MTFLATSLAVTSILLPAQRRRQEEEEERRRAAEADKAKQAKA